MQPRRSIDPNHVWPGMTLREERHPAVEGAASAIDDSLIDLSDLVAYKVRLWRMHVEILKLAILNHSLVVNMFLETVNQPQDG